MTTLSGYSRATIREIEMKRRILLTSIITIAAGPVLAGDSVITFGSESTGGNSIITFDCSACPPLKVEDRGPNVHGVEVKEIEIGGEKKIVQTDNLMGGSAVRYVRTSHSGPNSAGEVIAHTNGGTSVTTGNEGTIHVRPDMQPVTADAGDQTTYSGGGEFNIEEVVPEGHENDGVDDGSQTSSVNMNDAQHEVVGGETVENGRVENGTEILELRPTH
jgi:hypothetical protein